MVHCIVFGCGSRSDWDKGIGFYQIPSVIKNKSAFKEELTIERKGKWIQAISRGDIKAKDILKNEWVCGKYFVSGKPSPYWDKHNVDWVPTLELKKKSYGREIDYEVRAKRQERAKKREERAIKQQEHEAAEKRQRSVRNSVKAVFLWPRLTLISQSPPQKKKRWYYGTWWRQWVWWNQNENYKRCQVPSRHKVKGFGMPNHWIRIHVSKKHILGTG